MTTRPLALCLSLVLGLSTVTTAVAKTTDELLSEIQITSSKTPCQKTVGKAFAQCTVDTLKNWKVIKDDYNDAEEEEHTEWHLTNDSMGITEAYAKAHQAFHVELSEKQKTFKAAINIQKRLLTAAGKTIRISAPKSSARFTQRIDASQESSAATKCSYTKDTTALRICMRQVLRLNNPNVRKMGAGLRAPGRETTGEE